MSKCIRDFDCVLKPIQPGSELILVIINQNKLIPFTLVDMYEILKNKVKNQVSNEPASFNVLSYDILVDLSLDFCLKEKSNTIKLSKTKMNEKV